MKRFIALCLVLVLALSLCACGTNSETPTDNPTSQENVNAGNSTTSESEKKQPTASVDVSSWQLEDVVTEKDGTRATNWLKLPNHARNKGPGKVGYYGNGEKSIQIILLGERSEDQLNVAKLEDCLQEYLEDAVQARKSNDGWNYQNGVFEISSSKNVKVSDYEMCVYEGTHSFDWNVDTEEHVTEKFVAYGTKSKQNGAYICWIVLDQSEEQKDFETVKAYAESIAKSLQENVY